MKKFLLLGSALFIGFSSLAIEPKVFDDEYLTAISADAKWIAGQLDDGSVIIRNIETDKMWAYTAGSMPGSLSNYYIGFGKSVSSTGVVVGSTTGTDAAYWEDGKWTVLKTPYPQFMSNANSITPDGRVICGGIGNDNMSEDAENIILLPGIWVRQDDGSYGDPVILPHPDVDFTGRTPQYVTAVAISDDGKTVAGQIVDYMGLLPVPIIFTCDDNGEWSYKAFTDLINPTNIVFPKYPGEFNLQMPVAEWFMTEEEMEEYVNALHNWDGTTKYPNAEDFLSPEEKEQFKAAMEVYDKEYYEWEHYYDNFLLAYDECYINGYSFSFNNVVLSPDGKYYGTSSEVLYLNGTDNGYYLDNPVIITAATGELEDLLTDETDNSIIITAIAEDYTVLGTSMDNSGESLPNRAYIYPQKSDECMPLDEFIYERDPETADWMEENMTHEVYVAGPMGTLATRDFFISGKPVVTPDMTTALTCTTTTNWVDNNGYLYNSYLFPTGVVSSKVKEISASMDNRMTVTSNGNVDLKGEFISLSVYNLAGSVVLYISNPKGNIVTNLDNGIYIFKAMTSEGDEIIKKIAL